MLNDDLLESDIDVEDEKNNINPLEGEWKKDWLEDEVNREWARTALPSILAPPLSSTNRKGMKDAIKEKILRLRKLELEIARERITLSPIRTVPHEVLALVFKHWMNTRLTHLSNLGG
jgi:hypothetical protein